MKSSFKVHLNKSSAHTVPVSKAPGVSVIGLLAPPDCPELKPVERLQRDRKGWQACLIIDRPYDSQAA